MFTTNLSPHAQITVRIFISSRPPFIRLQSRNETLHTLSVFVVKIFRIGALRTITVGHRSLQHKQFMQTALLQAMLELRSTTRAV